MTTAATIDCLAHDSEVLELNVQSYRAERARKLTNGIQNSAPIKAPRPKVLSYVKTVFRRKVKMIVVGGVYN